MFQRVNIIHFVNIICRKRHNCPLVGLMRFVAYLCAMVGSGVNGLNSPTTC
nr:MAG TPA: hypothetical protein [Caudoviricetes sp.]